LRTSAAKTSFLKLLKCASMTFSGVSMVSSENGSGSPTRASANGRSGLYARWILHTFDLGYLPRFHHASAAPPYAKNWSPALAVGR